MSDFDDFYDRKYRSCLALAYARVGNWADAEDLVQDAFADAARRWPKVSTYDDPTAFVRRAVMNRASSRWRRVGRELKALARVASRTSGTVAAVDPVDTEFWSAVRRLPKQQAKAVVLFYAADLSVADVADHLGCSAGAAKAHLSKARSTLERAMSDPARKEKFHD